MESNKIIERKHSLFDTETDAIFNPVYRYDQFFGSDKSIYTELLVMKQVVKKDSRSFLFSGEFIDKLRKKRVEILNKDSSMQTYYTVIENLLNYAHHSLVVVDTRNTGLISLDTLPIVFNHQYTAQLDDGHGKLHNAIGTIPVQLANISILPEDTIELLEDIVKNMNIVLEQLVPVSYTHLTLPTIA